MLFYLDTESLMRVRLVSTLFEGAAQDECAARVRQYTRPFVNNIRSFYSLLGALDGVVSGSAALAVLMAGSERDDFVESSSDLDVYVPSYHARDAVLAFLERYEGYAVDHGRAAAAEQYASTKPSHIASLSRLSRRDGDLVRCVDIIVGSQHSATTPLTSFWGTLVMNYISSTTIVCLYPRMTLAGHFFVNPIASVERLERPLAKYRRRGFHQIEFSHGKADCTAERTYCIGAFRF